LIWGPSDKLLIENNELQEIVKKIGKAGVKILACKACADRYNASKKLEELGVEVKYTGDVLTNFIKEGRHILTL
jgi:hypothetical protein